MPATPNLALPYPAAADTADVPRDIKALADKLDLFGGAAGSLPASPTDGQECFYLADATNGILWHLRYRAAATGAYKWEFVGGSPLMNDVATTEPTPASTAWVDLATVGPVVTLPLAGDYIVTVGARINQVTGGVTVAMSYTIGATAPNAADGVLAQLSAGGIYETAVRERRKNGLGAVALTAKYHGADTSQGVFSDRWMRVTPIRVG